MCTGTLSDTTGTRKPAFRPFVTGFRLAARCRGTAEPTQASAGLKSAKVAKLVEIAKTWKFTSGALGVVPRVRRRVRVAQTGRLSLPDSQAVRNAAIYAALSLNLGFSPPRRPGVRPLEA